MRSSEGGATKLLGFSGTALAVTKGVITAVVATVTIAFLTLFMLLEGPAWVERFYRLLPEEQQPRWRSIGDRDLQDGRRLRHRQPGDQRHRRRHLDARAARRWACRTRSRSASSSPSSTSSRSQERRSPPSLVSTVAFLDSTKSGIIVLIFFILYQQLENHVLQPIVYGRTVQLSPLVVLISVLDRRRAGRRDRRPRRHSRSPGRSRCSWSTGSRTGNPRRAPPGAPTTV